MITPARRNMDPEEERDELEEFEDEVESDLLEGYDS